MSRLYESLSENDRRRYAAIEEKNWVMEESVTFSLYLSVMTKPSKRVCESLKIKSAWSREKYGRRMAED